MPVRVRAKLIKTSQNIREPQARSVLERAGTEDVTGQLHGIFEGGSDRGDTQLVAVRYLRIAARTGIQIDIAHLSQLRCFNALQLCESRIGVG